PVQAGGPDTRDATLTEAHHTVRVVLPDAVRGLLGQGEHIILTIRVPWLAGGRASTRAATVRLSSLVRCPSRAPRDQRHPTTHAETVRETARPHGGCGRREREEASHAWDRGRGRSGCLSVDVVGHG